MQDFTQQGTQNSDYQIAQNELLQSILHNKSEIENRDTLGTTVPIRLFQVFRLIAMGSSMEGLVGTGAPAMVYQSGKNLGEIIGQAAKDKDIDTYVGKIGMLCKQLSIGILVPTKVNLDAGEINLRVDECVSCAGIHNVSSPICQFEAGMVGGIVQVFSGRQVKATETKCNAIGDKTCLIEAKIL